MLDELVSLDRWIFRMPVNIVMSYKLS